MNTSRAHLFIAVPLPNSMKQQLSDWCQHIQQQLLFSKWIHPSDYHITLKFLGGVDDDTAVKLKPLIGQIASEQSDFSLMVEGLNTFGKAGSPRILWTGVEGELKPLHNLQRSIDDMTELLGFVKEARAYTPHLTLAKNYSGTSALETADLEQAASYLPIPLSWDVNEIVLYQTHLGRVPMYEPVETYSLINNLVGKST